VRVPIPRRPRQGVEREWREVQIDAGQIVVGNRGGLLIQKLRFIRFELHDAWRQEGQARHEISGEFDGIHMRVELSIAFEIYGMTWQPRERFRWFVRQMMLLQMLPQSLEYGVDDGGFICDVVLLLQFYFFVLRNDGVPVSLFVASPFEPRQDGRRQMLRLIFCANVGIDDRSRRFPVNRSMSVIYQRWICSQCRDGGRAGPPLPSERSVPSSLR